MQLLDSNGCFFELKIDSLDDLWVLSQFISEGDLVFSKTVRKVKIGGESSSRQVSKIIFIELLVSRVVFESESLRVSGFIQNETEFTAVGQSHTLTFKVSDKIKIKKQKVLKYEEKILKRAVSSKKSLNLLVLFDREDLVVAEFSEFSFKVLFEKHGLGSKKYSNLDVDENLEKFNLLKEYFSRDYSKIIFAGPGFFKESFKKYVESKLDVKIAVFSYPEVSSSRVGKVISKIFSEGILDFLVSAEEERKVSELLTEIGKSGSFSYGFDDVSKAILEGRVKDLLISSKFIEKAKDEGFYEELNSLMQTVENLSGSLFIINSKNEPGKILDGLSGIAVICRY